MTLAWPFPELSIHPGNLAVPKRDPSLQIGVTLLINPEYRCLNPINFLLNFFDWQHSFGVRTES